MIDIIFLIVGSYKDSFEKSSGNSMLVFQNCSIGLFLSFELFSKACLIVAATKYAIEWSADYHVFGSFLAGSPIIP